MSRLSVVLLTWNEEGNVGACLRALERQTRRDFDVVVVDAASTDGTVAEVEATRPELTYPLVLDVADTKLPIGEARNRGVQQARADNVAFLSADAEPGPEWVEQALASLEQHDMVFGRQVHAPHAWTLGAAVRGLRYHFPDGPAEDPLVFASNVAAAFRRDILLRHPFDPWADAAEDLLLARRAAAEGRTAAYNPRMVVRHHDVATLRQEMRKNLREGRGWGVYSDELGLLVPFLGWGAALALALAASALHPAGLLVLAGVLWAPALRRGLRRRREMPLRHVAAGVAASPVFDLAFLAQYLRGLARRKARTGRARRQGTEA